MTFALHNRGNHRPREEPLKNYRGLKVWEKAHALNLAIYAETQKFPDHERHRLTDQMLRASLSIPSNIAEGCGRNSDPDLARFFTIAKGSASELDYHLMLSGDLGYLDGETCGALRNKLDEIQKMLAAFILRIRMSL